MQIKGLRLNKKKIFLILLSLGTAGMVVYLAWFNQSCFSDQEESLRFVDRRGELLGFYLVDQNRYSAHCGLSQVSPHFIRAIVLAEDRGFYSHKGVNLSSLTRALFQNVQEGKVVSGGSTITMQLAKLLLNANQKRTIFRKLEEIIFALKLELHLPKSRILEEYINRLPFGNMIYGIGPASEFYFGKSPAQLSLSQALELAVIPKAPTTYNPIKNKDQLKARRDWILDEFYRQGFVSSHEYRRVASEEVHFNIRDTLFVAPHFIELIKRRYGNDLSDHKKIYTTLDRNLQLKVRGIIREHLQRLRPYHVQSAAAVVIDNRSYEVLAYLGSPDYFNVENNGYVDYALALRQPGSTLKPFVYGVALESGYTPSSILPDIQFPARGGFFPRNHDGMEHGPLRLRTSLACSYNIPAFYLAIKLTPTRILEKLQLAGFSYLDEPAAFYGEAIALGSGEVRLLDLVTAYSCLANKGVLYEPRLLKEWPAGGKRQIFSPQCAFLLFDILSDPAARAGSFGFFSSMNLPFPLAIKTGTSKGFRDKWAVAVNSEYTVGVWLGNPSGQNISQQVVETGNSATIVRDIFLILQKDWEQGGLPIPPGIIQREVCALSGELAGPYCQDRVEEYFEEKNLPEGPCSYHVKAEAGIKTVYPELYREWWQKNQLTEQTHLGGSQEVEIVSPQQGDRYYISQALPLESQQIRFKVMGAADGEKITYRLNKRIYRILSYPSFPLFQLKPGEYLLEIEIAGECRDRVSFVVH
jgi:penicillin-binding protein 1C